MFRNNIKNQGLWDWNLNLDTFITTVFHFSIHQYLAVLTLSWESAAWGDFSVWLSVSLGMGFTLLGDKDGNFPQEENKMNT